MTGYKRTGGYGFGHPHDYPTKPENAELVFVYGTLMEGLTAHYLLEQVGIVKVGWGEIEARLFDLGSFPAVVPTEEEDRIVKGELYRVPRQYLRVLDQYEGVENGLYRRERVDVMAANNNVSWPDTAWVYFYNNGIPPMAHVIEDGDYRKFLERQVPRGFRNVKARNRYHDEHPEMGDLG